MAGLISRNVHFRRLLANASGREKGASRPKIRPVVVKSGPLIVRQVLRTIGKT